MATKKKEKLIPPDLRRCQAEKPNGNTFMTLGGQPGLVRCNAKPTVIVTEKKKSKDGQIGSMSLCNPCWRKFIDQLGKNYATAEPILKHTGKVDNGKGK